MHLILTLKGINFIKCSKNIWADLVPFLNKKLEPTFSNQSQTINLLLSRKKKLFQVFITLLDLRNWEKKFCLAKCNNQESLLHNLSSFKTKEISTNLHNLLKIQLKGQLYSQKCLIHSWGKLQEMWETCNFTNNMKTDGRIRAK